MGGQRTVTINNGRQILGLSAMTSSVLFSLKFNIGGNDKGINTMKADLMKSLLHSSVTLHLHQFPDKTISARKSVPRTGLLGSNGAALPELPLLQSVRKVDIFVSSPFCIFFFNLMVSVKSFSTYKACSVVEEDVWQVFANVVTSEF